MAKPQTLGSSTSLADILERVLDKGVVIAGDISISIGEVELLSIKIRLVIASVDKAREMGIDWWRNDPALSSLAGSAKKETQGLELEQRQLQLELENERLRAELRELRGARLGDLPGNNLSGSNLSGNNLSGNNARRDDSPDGNPDDDR